MLFRFPFTGLFATAQVFGFQPHRHCRLLLQNHPDQSSFPLSPRFLQFKLSSATMMMDFAYVQERPT